MAFFTKNEVNCVKVSHISMTQSYGNQKIYEVVNISSRCCARLLDISIKIRSNLIEMMGLIKVTLKAGEIKKFTHLT